MKRIMPIIGLWLVFAVLGCASLQNYTLKVEPARSLIMQDNFAGALKTFPDKEAEGKDEILLRLERAMILQDLGRFDQSSADFEKAFARYREYQDKAVISASEAVSEAGTLLINEQVMPYEGQDFEIILLHALDAVNYLMRGDLEGARVEVRNSYEQQELLLGKHERGLKKAQSDSRSSGWEQSFDHADRMGYERLKKKASTVVSLYENAFASYLSAFVYELGGEYDDAYIDLKKAYQAYPTCRCLQRDLVRLSRKTGSREDQAMWEERFGKFKPGPKEGTDVFVIFSYGLAPYKVPVTFPIPTAHGFVFASLPVYEFSYSPIHGGLIVSDGISEDTSTVFDVDAVAARNLLDDFPILFLKQVVRSYIKAKATSQISQRQGDIGAIIGTLFSAVTERADLRAWSTLPKQIQVARIFVPKSSTEISLKALPSGGTSVVEIPRGASHMIIYCRATEKGLATYTKSF